MHFAGANIENYKSADQIFKIFSVCRRTPHDLYTYASMGITWQRALDISPAGTTYDDELRCIGPSCEFKGADDRSTQRYADIREGINDVLKSAKTKNGYRGDNVERGFA
jgi:hypothetical protein